MRTTKILELSKELLDLIPYYPNTPKAVRASQIQGEIEELYGSLTESERKEIDSVFDPGIHTH